VTDTFAHQLKLDAIRDGERLDLVADERERTAIAERLGIGRLDRLDAHAELSRTGELVRVKGRLMAALDQECVVTGEPVPAHIDEAFEVMFMRAPEVSDPDEEVELGASDCDVVFYDGGTIDLGSAIADSLALSLDPYPRSAGAETTLKEAGVMTEEQASPFAILAQLKRGAGDET
jgi:uncharacterized metal-binding protein YceD (DUF177 family)